VYLTEPRLSGFDPSELSNQGREKGLVRLLPAVRKGKVEDRVPSVCGALAGGADIFNNGRTKNRLTATRLPVQPEMINPSRFPF
jgi:hypothetical protein